MDQFKVCKAFPLWSCYLLSSTAVFYKTASLFPIPAGFFSQSSSWRLYDSLESEPGLKPLSSEGIDVKQVQGAGAGRILVAKPWEYNHFTSKACLFVYQHDEERGSRAVVLERPLAFNLAELAPPFESSIFAEHTVFLGGEQGGDMAVLLHPYAQIPGAKPVGGGLYYGGLKGAESMLREQEEEGIDHGLSPHRFKWWFNYMSWGPGQLDSQIANGSWDVVEADANAVLRQGPILERDLWATLRRHYLPREEDPNE